MNPNPILIFYTVIYSIWAAIAPVISVTSLFLNIFVQTVTPPPPPPIFFEYE